MTSNKAAPQDHHDDNDEFFGNDMDDDNDHDFMARQEGKAAEHNLQTTAYLDSYDESKEERLQEGFEDGYRQVYELAQQLGERLGRMVALSKLQGTPVPTIILTRYRQVLGQINQGTVSNETVQQVLLELQQEVAETIG